MKTSDRFMERLGIPQAEVLICPMSCDIEVWYGDDCHLKIYIAEIADKEGRCTTTVGRSMYLDQTIPDNPEWQALVSVCKPLARQEAFDRAFQYAVKVARQIEQPMRAAN